MEYFWIKIRTGAPGGLDKAGGVHVHKTPQVVEIRCENRISRLWRKLKAKVFGDEILGDPAYSIKGSFELEDFVVEVPSTVNADRLTAGRKPDRLVFVRVLNMADVEGAPLV